MQKYSIVLALLAIAITYAAAQSVTAVTDYTPGRVRALTVVGSPSLASPTGIAVVGTQLEYRKENETYSAEIDAYGFGFRNPAHDGGSLLFYLGAFTGSGEWTPSVEAASVQAALAELAGTYISMAGYYDRDGNAGFQWKSGDTLFCFLGSPSTQTDCIEVLSIRNLGDMTWGDISVTNASCPEGYTDKCRIYSFTTGTTDGAFSITIHLASEPVLINGVRVNPGYGKIDLTVKYPNWNGVTAPGKADLKLVLLSAYAGRARTASATKASIDGSDGLVFQTSTKQVYFSWDEQSKIGLANKKVYAQPVRASVFGQYDCSACTGADQLVINALKTLSNLWKSFDWAAEFVFFSWNDKNPGEVVWDPKIGVIDDSTSVQMQEDSAAAISFSALALVVAVVLNVFVQ